MRLKTETAMEDTKHGKTAVCVDEIINGIRSCKIGVDSSITSEVGLMLENLSLDNNRDEKLQTPTDLTSQPREGQEVLEDRSEADQNGETVEEMRVDGLKIPGNLVTLEAPYYDEEDYSGQSSDEEIVDCLRERGPMNGKPCKFQRKPIQSGNFCQPSELLVSFNHAAMPPNFPDYSNGNVSEINIKGSKRLIDKTRPEAPKYVRNKTETVLGETAAGHVFGAVPGSVKTIVQPNQMVGGTVYTRETPPPSTDQVCNGMFDIQNSYIFPDFLNLESDVSSSSIPQDVVNFILGPNTIQKNGVQRHLIGNAEKNVDLHPQKGLNQQCSFPPEYQRVRRDARGSSDDYSEGYCSDFSPPETHPSSLDSPHSAVAASPVSVKGSPPWRNLSSPQSNKSRWSIDSGVSSPMPEDFSGCSSQKSPRDGCGLHQQKSMSNLYEYTPKSCMARSFSAGSKSDIKFQNLMLQQDLTLLPEQQVIENVQHSSYSETYFSEYINKNQEEFNSALDVVYNDLMETELKKKFTLPPQEGNIGVPGSAADIRIGIGSVRQLSDVVDRTSKGNPGINEVLKPELQGLTFVFTSANTSTPNPSLNTSVTISQPAMNTFVTISQPVVNTHSKPPHPIVGTPGTVSHPTMNISSGLSHTTGNNYGNLSQPIANTSVTVLRPVADTYGAMSQPLADTYGAMSQPLLDTYGAMSQPLADTYGALSQPLLDTYGSISQPIVNKAGKVAIPASKKKSPQMTPSLVVPLFIILPQNDPVPVKSHFRNIAPKDPTKQIEKISTANGKPTNFSNPQINNCSAGHEEKLSNVVPVSEKKNVDRELDAKRRNLARRLVAELSEYDLKSKDEDDEDTCLHITVCKPDCVFMGQALLERLFREGLSDMINVQNLQGQTALYLAASTNNAEMVQLLVEHGADVNTLAESKTSAGTPEKLAAIHIVSTKGDTYLQTLQALLRAPGIDLNQVNSDGQTALNCAILAHRKVSRDMTHINSIPIIQALIHAGADPNLPVQQSGKTGLMYALETRDLDLIEKTFQLVEPSKLDTVLKTRAFDGSTCLKIADSLKMSLGQDGKQRLFNCLKPGTNRRVFGAPS